jgi:lipoprotein-releasing system ATP-binding protein
MIAVKNLNKSYGELQVLKDINLDIEEGKITVIVGASGAGKSTLLQLIGTLDSPDSGDISINKQSITALTSNEIAALRNDNIGFVFQFHHLLPEFTALENVIIPARINGKDLKIAEQRAKDLLIKLGLNDRMDHKPNQLSGGEQQRVAVARALINQPKLILADEPSGNLDSNNAKELHELFIQLRDELNQTFVIVTHNEDLTQLADRVVQIADGGIKK